MSDERPLDWLGSTKEDLSSFPQPVKRSIGNALGFTQLGIDPNDAPGVVVKPLKGLSGTTVMEIVERYHTDTYRAVYTAKIGNTIYVLHCFQKKAKHGIATPKEDIKIIEARLKRAQEKANNEI